MLYAMCMQRIFTLATVILKPLQRKKVSYPFGFGLSYTDFSVEVLNTRADGTKAELTVLVKNIGKTAGKEVVQVYVCPPQGKLGKPVRNLNSFLQDAAAYARRGGGGKSRRFPGKECIL